MAPVTPGVTIILVPATMIAAASGPDGCPVVCARTHCQCEAGSPRLVRITSTYWCRAQSTLCVQLSLRICDHASSKYENPHSTNRCQSANPGHLCGANRARNECRQGPIRHSRSKGWGAINHYCPYAPRDTMPSGRITLIRRDLGREVLLANNLELAVCCSDFVARAVIPPSAR